MIEEVVLSGVLGNPGTGLHAFAVRLHQPCRHGSIDQLPKSQQKFVAQMLDALIAQATTKASSEGREVLQ
ncbi:hypothetical protein [Pseudomonas guariconensis]|uniref:hypothetical protein n=1 Tax=Pseudomonas guariconensis TaxID=1288410 RepID=UPI0018D5D01C|nr:hypothetical protein [Pseudomonas guariconensis]MBH3361371.1 hypothetical protein [Pseudomonas guariconensis]